MRQPRVLPCTKWSVTLGKGLSGSIACNEPRQGSNSILRFVSEPFTGTDPMTENLGSLEDPSWEGRARRSDPSAPLRSASALRIIASRYYRFLAGRAPLLPRNSWNDWNRDNTTPEEVRNETGDRRPGSVLACWKKRVKRQKVYPAREPSFKGVSDRTGGGAPRQSSE